MPADNERFGASGAVARPKICANLQVLRPSERQWKPRLRQAANTLVATRETAQRKRLGESNKIVISMEQDSNLDNVMDNFEQQENLLDKEIFTKIWTSPRKVFRYLNERNYDKYMTILLLLSGISRAFNQAATKKIGDKMSIWAILVICIIFGGLLGWVSYYIYAALISWTGKWLKGEGNTNSILRIISYAMIPSIIALIFLIPQIGIYGNEIFKSDGDITSAGLGSNILVYLTFFLEVVFGIWTIILCIIGISEVQKFSIGKSILNLLLPGLLILIPVLLIVLFTKMF
jgi:hypothetical protein